MFRLSASQVKTFCASRAKWAGQYILGIKDVQEDEGNFALGDMAEHRLMYGEDNMSLVEKRNIKDPEKLMEQYDNIKHNAIGLEFKKGQHNFEVNGSLLGEIWVAYIDNYCEDCIDDIKTAHYLTKPDNTSINSRSGMSTYDEYKLQLWVYMKLTGIKKSRILEVAKHRYADGRNAHQILEFELTPQFDKEMIDRYEPIIKEMNELYKHYKKY